MISREILPPERCLEHIAQSELDDLNSILVDHFESNGNSFAEQSAELAMPMSLRLTELLADIICVDEPTHAEKVVSYRAFFFAYTVSHFITPGKIAVAPIKELEGFDPEEARDFIWTRTEDFLMQHETLRELIYTYQHLIDRQYINPEIVVRVAALTFMQIEAFAREVYLDEQEDELLSLLEHDPWSDPSM